MDKLWLKMQPNMQDEYEVVMGLPLAQQAIYVTYLVNGQVSNGGFAQFYTGSSGRFAPAVADAFTAIGAVQLAALAQEVHAIYNDGGASLEAEDDELLEKLSETYGNNLLDELDQRYYQLMRAEGLADLQIKFIRQHKAAFVSE
jgi:hypothetical protein